MALPTAAAIRALSLPELSGTTEDTYLTTQIVAADAHIAAWCLFPNVAGTPPTMEATAYTTYLDGPTAWDPRILRVGLRPITTLTSVKQDTTGDWSYATTESSSNYTLDGAKGLIYAKPATTLAWGSGLRYIQVVATAGFNVGADSRLTQAIALLVAMWHAERGPTQAVDTQTLLGGGNATYRPDLLPQAVRELVWPYRLIEREGL